MRFMIAERQDVSIAAPGRPLMPRSARTSMPMSVLLSGLFEDGEVLTDASGCSAGEVVAITVPACRCWWAVATRTGHSRSECIVGTQRFSSGEVLPPLPVRAGDPVLGLVGVEAHHVSP